MFEITSAAEQTVSDGVYYIQSAVAVDNNDDDLELNNYPFLTAKFSSLDYSDVFLTHNAIATTPQERTNQIWKVTHWQNGYYTIRPYHHTLGGLFANTNNNNAEIYTLGYDLLCSDCIDILCEHLQHHAIGGD